MQLDPLPPHLLLTDARNAVETLSESTDTGAFANWLSIPGCGGHVDGKVCYAVQFRREQLHNGGSMARPLFTPLFSDRCWYDLRYLWEARGSQGGMFLVHRSTPQVFSSRCVSGRMIVEFGKVLGKTAYHQAVYLTLYWPYPTDFKVSHPIKRVYMMKYQQVVPCAHRFPGCADHNPKTWPAIIVNLLAPPRRETILRTVPLCRWEDRTVLACFGEYYVVSSNVTGDCSSA